MAVTKSGNTPSLLRSVASSLSGFARSCVFHRPPAFAGPRRWLRHAGGMYLFGRLGGYLRRRMIAHMATPAPARSTANAARRRMSNDGTGAGVLCNGRGPDPLAANPFPLKVAVTESAPGRVTVIVQLPAPLASLPAHESCPSDTATSPAAVPQRGTRGETVNDTMTFRPVTTEGGVIEVTVVAVGHPRSKMYTTP